MAKKEFSYRGKKLEELKEMNTKELANLMTSQLRRKLFKRGMTEQQKIIIEKIKKGEKIRTHRRDMPILPLMVGMTIQVYNGKTFEQVRVEAEMIGHVLGEFAPSRKIIKHSSPGVGATKSSSSASVK